MSDTVPLTAKQREIRHRETRILDIARPLIHRGGLSSVNMDAIAREMRCTRGTIYNHFPNKEDILLALAARAVDRRIGLFRFAIDSVRAMPGRTHRDACASVGIAAEVYVDELPDDFAIEQAIRHDSVWEKTSEGRRHILGVCESNCISVIAELIQAAIQCGDLRVARGTTASALTQQIVFGLWSLVYGGLLIESTSPSLAEVGIPHPRQAIRQNCNALLDNLGWEPLYRARTYNSMVKRITPALIEQAHVLTKADPTGESS
ncbi:MAG: TetR/AcrR family transcriptional regulator [Planctomycetota bacterium]